MNDREIAQLARRARPVQAAEAPSVQEAGHELLEAILSESPAFEGKLTTEHEVTVLPARPKARLRAPWLLGAAAALAAVAAMITPMTLLDNGGSVVPAAELPEKPLQGKGNPRLFLQDANWKLTSLSQDGNSGEETFQRDESTSMTIYWAPSKFYESFAEDRDAGTQNVDEIQLFGEPAKLYEFDDNRFETLIPPTGGVYISIRTDGIVERRAYLEILSKVGQLELQDWHDAMPAGIVVPEQSDAAIVDIVSKVRLPIGFDPTDLIGRPAEQKYHLAVAVIGGATCAWLDQYSQARRDDDEPGMGIVAGALGESRNWPILKEMEAEGDWPQSVYEYADKVAARQSVDGYRQILPCTD